MFENIKKYQNHPLFAQLQDIRSIGLVVFTVIVVLVSWSGVKAIEKNYQLQQQVSRLRQENDIKKLQNDNQKLRNEYYKTPQYLELAARQNFGLAAPGEKELIVPKEVAMARVKGVTAAASPVTAESGAARPEGPFYERNLRAWLDFFLHR